MTLKILALSGSGRKGSSNRALLEALRIHAPEGIEIAICDAIWDLPIFTPDRDGADRPAAVAAFIAEIDAADGVIISSPEYVRAIPGGLKNAIDWLVSGEAVIGKPIALVHASHRGDDMLTDLRRVLSTITSRFAEDVFWRLPLMSLSAAERDAVLAAPETIADLRSYLTAFQQVVEGHPEI
ncbi:NADPH-dependent FMN reductase [Celeribacter neptunius]|uniref:NADPH-dependent FMN reductase n=1 Tax=Celeribacter neptunius TaxID=588602 RepID=A0A1I3LTB2_9RHOB|nr:NADPH-dependent FMN reductase [Celeribacter neptunius]SFI87780.1 NADPH-dependent FMN reductase [Celeribacter neptunius]